MMGCFIYPHNLKKMGYRNLAEYLDDGRQWPDIEIATEMSVCDETAAEDDEPSLPLRLKSTVARSYKTNTRERFGPSYNDGWKQNRKIKWRQYGSCYSFPN